MNLFQKYGIKEVADVVFYSITKIGDEEVYTPVLLLDTLKVSTIEKTAEKVEAKGGKGNKKLITWNYGKEITLTLEDALFSPASMSMIMGGKLDSSFGLPMSALMKVQTANSYAQNHYSIKSYPSPTLTDEEWEEVFRVLEREKIKVGYSDEERSELSKEFYNYYTDEYKTFLGTTPDYTKDIFHTVTQIKTDSSYCIFDFETIYNTINTLISDTLAKVFDTTKINDISNIFVSRNRQKIKDNYYQRTTLEFLNMSQNLLTSSSLVGNDNDTFKYYSTIPYISNITDTNRLKNLTDLFTNTKALGNEIIFPIYPSRIAKGKLTLHNITLPNGKQFYDLLYSTLTKDKEYGLYYIALPIEYSYSYRAITPDNDILPEYDYNNNTDIIDNGEDVTGELTTDIRYYKKSAYLCFGINYIEDPNSSSSIVKISKKINPAILNNGTEIVQYASQLKANFTYIFAITSTGELTYGTITDSQNDDELETAILKYPTFEEFMISYVFNNTEYKGNDDIILSQVPIHYFFNNVNISTNNNIYLYPVFCKDSEAAAKIFSHMLKPKANFWKGYPVALNDCVVHGLANDIKTYQDITKLNTNISDTEIVDRMEKCLVTNKNGLEIDVAQQRQNLIRYYTNDQSSSYTIFYDAKTMLPIFYSPKDSSEHSDIYQIDYISEQHQKVKLKMGTIYYKWTRTVMNLDDTGMTLGNTFVIDADTFPEAYKIVGETYIRNQKTGRDQRYQFTINRATVSSDTSVTLEAEGDPTTFSMTIDVLCPPNEIMMQLKQYDIIEDTEQGGYQIKTQSHKRSKTPVYVEEFQRTIDVNNDEIY